MFRTNCRAIALPLIGHALLALASLLVGACGSGSVGGTTEVTTELYPSGSVKARGSIRRTAGVTNRVGSWTFYYENGTVQSSGPFDSGKKSGVWETFHPDGSLKARGPFLNDLEEGHFVYFFPNGNRNAEGAMSKGLNVGEWTYWYENGQLKRRGTIGEGNQPVGKWTYWYDNGALQQEGHFKHGKEDGVWTVFSRDGKQSRKVTYQEGVEKK